MRDFEVSTQGQGSVIDRQIRKLSPSADLTFTDQLAVEEPLEIRLDFQRQGQRIQKSISITMRTPGANLREDLELSAGFLFTEGLVQSAKDLLSLKHCGPAAAATGLRNVVKIELAHAPPLKSLERNFYTTSSCGVCGKSSIQALTTQNQFSRQTGVDLGPVVARNLITDLPSRLRRAQAVFAQTGGLHASGLFSAQGELRALREDVGRHNALDKLIGQALLAGHLPLHEVILVLSGRISFELVQKAAMAGIRFVAAVGAPSSLAVELGQQMGMTLIGFIRDEHFNVYHGDWRVR